MTLTPVTQVGEQGQIGAAATLLVTLDATGRISQPVVSVNQLPQLRVSEQVLGTPTYTYTISPPVARTDTVTNASGSATVTDAAILSGDAGKAVAGAGVPIVSYVGTVTPGVSFTLVDALGSPSLTTANVTSVVVGAVDLSTVPRNTGTAVQTYVLGSAVGQVGGPAGPLTGLRQLPASQVPAAPAVTLTFNTTLVTDVSLGTYFRCLLTGSFTLATPLNPVDDLRVIWELTQDGTGSHVLTLGAGFELGTDLSSVTLSTASGAKDLLGAIYNAITAKWMIVAFLRGFA